MNCALRHIRHEHDRHGIIHPAYPTGYLQSVGSGHFDVQKQYGETSTPIVRQQIVTIGKTFDIEVHATLFAVTQAMAIHHNTHGCVIVDDGDSHDHSSSSLIPYLDCTQPLSFTTKK